MLQKGAGKQSRMRKSAAKPMSMMKSKKKDTYEMESDGEGEASFKKCDKVSIKVSSSIRSSYQKVVRIDFSPTCSC